MKQALPNRQIRLALWYMLYQVPLGVDLDNDFGWQVTCANHLKLHWKEFEALRQDFPRHWRRMLEKRARRLAYARAHGGHCPPGWTPWVPGEKERPAPVGALKRRFKTYEGKLICFLTYMLPRQKYEEELKKNQP
jgi:hypothetical protein